MAKRTSHPAGGLLRFDIEILSAPHEDDQRLVIYTAEPDAPTAAVLPILASWDDQLASATLTLQHRQDDPIR